MRDVNIDLNCVPSLGKVEPGGAMCNKRFVEERPLACLLDGRGLDCEEPSFQRTLFEVKPCHDLCFWPGKSGALRCDVQQKARLGALTRLSAKLEEVRLFILPLWREGEDVNNDQCSQARGGVVLPRPCDVQQKSYLTTLIGLSAEPEKVPALRVPLCGA